MAWTGWALTLLIWAVWGALLTRDPGGVGRTPTDVFTSVVWWVVLVGLAIPIYATVGAVLSARQPGNPVGWVCLSAGLGAALHAATYEYAASAPAHEAQLAQSAALLGNASAEAVFPLMLTLLVVWFPGGPLPGRWRLLVAAAIIGAGVAALGEVLEPVLQVGASAGLPNPLGGNATAAQALEVAGRAIGVLALLGAAAGLVASLRSPSTDEQRRLQMQWFAYCGALAAALLAAAALAGLAGWTWPALALGTMALGGLCLGLPLTILTALVRRRLYGIRLVINRTLVYGGLMAGLFIAYGLGSLAGGLAIPQRGYASAAGTAIAALLLLPLRAQLQRLVNRLMYGEAADPMAVLRRLGDQLEAAGPDALAKVAMGLALGLRVDTIEIYLEGVGVVAGAGDGGEVRETFPLLRGGDRLGELRVSSGGPLSGTERRLLRRLAPQLAVGAEAALLMIDLRRSRQNLVRAREEERRRLRRDLHDGLGPALAGISLGLEASRRRLPSDPDEAERLIVQAATATRDVVDEVRRLVNDLRPPALDELGLVGAISAHAAAAGGHPLMVAVAAGEDLPDLPAAVEVAAFRIVTEAVANARRHAGARHCDVRLRFDGDLEVEVSDDGCGFREPRPGGVGLGSMRERASELGGELRIESRPGVGTKVIARLPVPS